MKSLTTTIIAILSISLPLASAAPVNKNNAAGLPLYPEREDLVPCKELEEILGLMELSELKEILRICEDPVEETAQGPGQTKDKAPEKGQGVPGASLPGFSPGSTT